jgi:serine/threonine-protein kinase
MTPNEPVAAPVNPLPSRIGRYVIEAELGRGMMGVIYLARDPDLGRTVALKTVALAFSVSNEDREAFQRRFLEEARIAARLSHPGIVVVHEVGRDGDTGVLFMALEYLRGRTLAQMMGGGARLPWEDVLQITGRVGEALHHAHEEGVVHRDIKPANIMVLDTGETKILDFGVAKTPAQQLTAAGQFFGTPAYMSPEQACGLNVDGRSDLFSLGCVAYQALTGATPFTADNIPLLLARILNDEPPSPSTIVPEIPADVDVLIGRLLAKDRRRRYENGRALAEDIENTIRRRPLRPFAAAPVPPSGAQPSEPSVDTLDLRLSFLLDEDPAVDAPVSPPGQSGVLASAESTAPAALPSGTVPFRRKSLPPLATAALALIVMGIVFFLALGQRVGEQEAPVATTREVPAFGAGPAAPPAPGSAPASVPAETVPSNTAATATGAAVSAPPGRPDVVPAPRPPAVRPGPDTPGADIVRPSRLRVEFDHHLKYGTMRAWIDDDLRLERELTPSSTRNLLFTRLYRGRVAETMEVAPGNHRVRVEVAWEGRRRVAQTFGRFDAGGTRRLEVTVGMLRPSVGLEWQDR